MDSYSAHEPAAGPVPWLLGAYWLDSPLRDALHDAECRWCGQLGSARAQAPPRGPARRSRAAWAGGPWFGRFGSSGRFGWISRAITHAGVRRALLVFTALTTVGAFVAALPP
ncbi:hypothetical protein [Streptomyces sp. NPDC047928]|uniref:hypothetical protein n=1 Tax=unclassified Streptomyces TaxID=2593676 RepID=UPI0037204F23